MGKIYNSIEELVGLTPLLRLQRMEKKLKLKARLFGKCEFFNPSFSPKDRVAKHLMEKIPFTKITKHTIFVAACADNMAVSLASQCAVHGYKLVLIMPDDTPKEYLFLINNYGAEVILTPKEEGKEGAKRKARLLAQKNKDVFLLDQMEPDINLKAHMLTTSMELLGDLKNEIDVFVSSVNTYGTLTGTVQALKTCLPDLYVVAATQQNKEGLENFSAETTFFSPFYDKECVNESIAIDDAESFKVAQTCAALEGLAVGPSSGRSLAAAIKIAKREESKEKNIVVMLPDSIERCVAMRYLETD